MGVLFDVAPVAHALAPLIAYAYPNVDLTPTSRITSSATRATRGEALSALVDDFDATIDAVALIEITVASLMLGLRQRRARIQTALAPVTALPTETLREIFLIAAANDTTSKTHIMISHVSSHWRAVSTDIKQLWTTISYPGMLHECAERSKDLRLHLTPAPKARWPFDLEITAAEASRVSTWLLRLFTDVGDEVIGGRPRRFTSSLERHAPLLAVDRVEIAGASHIREDTTTSRKFRLCSSEDYALHSICKTQLAEVAISNVSVGDCEIWLSLLSKDAPLLSRVQLATIFGFEDEQENEQIVDQHQMVRPQCCDQLESLTVMGCVKDIYLPLLDNWEMPSLVSLTLDLRETPGQIDWMGHEGTLLDSLLIVVRMCA